jgi:hypothetical protein
MEATEGPAATLAAQRAAARTGKREAVTPDTASLVAEDSSTTAAEVAGEPAVTAVVAVMVAAAAQEASSAAAVEGSAEWAATTPAGEATATKRAAEKFPADQSILEDQFFISIQKSNHSHVMSSLYI